MLILYIWWMIETLSCLRLSVMVSLEVFTHSVVGFFLSFFFFFFFF